MLESSSADDIPPPSVLKLPADLIKKMSWPLLKTLLRGFQTIIESYVHITQDYTKNMVWKKLLKVIKLCSVHHRKTFLVPKKRKEKKVLWKKWADYVKPREFHWKVQRASISSLALNKTTNHLKGAHKRNLSPHDIRNVFLRRSSTINSSICLPAMVILHNKSKSSIKSGPTM